MDEDYTEALEANDDLVERLRHGDHWALPSLVEAITGARVTSHRVIEDERT